ncbi:hypothetical protein [Nocardioides sp. Kera G14]|uniref:hypothetical protein n=1 Tax=Nocardioides sp. Kera G14 TaxID=2884264 RepID=UPI001D0FA817|nr:hypothetical protein [Nocardioides sp. Kera G14]UDY24482.1 hypothetical protein LH076_04045 [Nocardioides sp. Kera G14]
MTSTGPAGSATGQVVRIDAPRERTRQQAGPRSQARRRSGIRGLIRRLGKARRPVLEAARAAAPVARAAAAPAVRAAAPAVKAVMPAVKPLAALTNPLAKVIGVEGAPRPILAIRHDGVDLPALPEVMRHLFPAADDHLAVFVPAAGEGEQVWRSHAAPLGGSYADRLAAALRWPTLDLRYDGGAELGEAALVFSTLLQDVADAWPVPLKRLVIVAHGDAGLLVRSALAVRSLAERPWADAVTEVVTLGTPALGTDTEALSAGVGRRLDEALAGIAVVPTSALDVPTLPHVDYLVVSDRLVGRPNPFGRVIGDLLWFRHRASRAGRHVVDLFPTAERFEVDTREHPLVNHPDLHDALLRWLA